MSHGEDLPVYLQWSLALADMARSYRIVRHAEIQAPKGTHQIVVCKVMHQDEPVIWVRWEAEGQILKQDFLSWPRLGVLCRNCRGTGLRDGRPCDECEDGVTTDLP